MSKRLTIDSVLEEEPQNDQIGHTADLVSYHNLCAHGKEEVAKVAGMAEVRVKTLGNQDVVIFLALRRDVVEANSCLRHGNTANNLSHNHQRQSQANCVCIAIAILQVGE